MISRVRNVNLFQNTSGYSWKIQVNKLFSNLSAGGISNDHYTKEYLISSKHKTLTTNTHFQISTIKQYVKAIFADPRVEDAILSYYKLNYELNCVKHKSQRYPKFQLDILDLACLLRRKGSEKEIQQLMQHVGKVDENLVSDPVEMQWYRVKYYNNKAFLSVKNIFEYHKYMLKSYQSLQELFKYYLEDEHKVESLSFYQEEFIHRLRTDLYFFIEFALSTHDIQGAIEYCKHQSYVLHKYNWYLDRSKNQNYLEHKGLLSIDDKEPKEDVYLKIVHTHTLQLQDTIDYVELLMEANQKQQALIVIEECQKNVIRFLEQTENVKNDFLYGLKGILFYQKMHALNINSGNLVDHQDYFREFLEIQQVTQSSNNIFYGYFIYEISFIIQSEGFTEQRITNIKQIAALTTEDEDAEQAGDYNLKFARFALKSNILSFKQADNTVVFMKLCFELAKDMTDKVIIDAYRKISDIFKIDLTEPDLIMNFQLKSEQFNAALGLVSGPNQKLKAIKAILLEFKLR